MEQKIKISGISCGSCVNKISKELQERFPNLKFHLDKDEGLLNIISSEQKLPTQKEIEHALNAAGNYSIAPQVDAGASTASANDSVPSGEVSNWELYKPIWMLAVLAFFLAIFFYRNSNQLNMMLIPQYTMAGFLIGLSFLQLLDLKGFAQSFARYDIIAKRNAFYAHAFPFIELTLGIAYLFSNALLTVNFSAFVIMSISSIGVYQVIKKGEQIQCACAGTNFNLPVGKVTLLENMVMAIMALMMMILA